MRLSLSICKNGDDSLYLSGTGLLGAFPKKFPRSPDLLDLEHGRHFVRADTLMKERHVVRLPLAFEEERWCWHLMVNTCKVVLLLLMRGD